jgi:predicted RNA-binding protein with TRAM domain
MTQYFEIENVGDYGNGRTRIDRGSVIIVANIEKGENES